MPQVINEDGKQEGAEDGALGNPAVTVAQNEDVVRSTHSLSPARNIGLEPG